MALYIHNLTEEDKTYQGREIIAGSIFRIPPALYSEYSEDTSVTDAIQNGDIVLSRDGVNIIENIENALIVLSNPHFRASIAVDKDGINQLISGVNPTVIIADRLLWDLGEDYDVATDDIVVPADGVYSFDAQLKVTNMSNVASVELAIYKRGDPDDYWFILSKQNVGSLTEIQLSGATLFDFYKDERYTLKIILTKVLPLIGCSCTISGDDDYTAWGYNLVNLF